MIAEIQKLAKTAMFDDVLDVIKEEAAELIQAASKVQRAHSSTNPTDISIDDAYRMIREEYTDMCLAINVLNEMNRANGEPCTSMVYYNRHIAKQKAKRWLKRITAEART